MGTWLLGQQVLRVGIVDILGIVITDFINRILQVLKEDLYWLRISAQDAGLMEPVELWDKG